MRVFIPEYDARVLLEGLRFQAKAYDYSDSWRACVHRLADQIELEQTQQDDPKPDTALLTVLRDTALKYQRLATKMEPGPSRAAAQIVGNALLDVWHALMTTQAEEKPEEPAPERVTFETVSGGTATVDAYLYDAHVRGYALGRAHANGRPEPTTEDWDAARQFWLKVPK